MLSAGKNQQREKVDQTMSKAECSLRDLHVGDKGRIERVSVSGELGRRIRDLGLIPGTSITVVGRAPLRDPVALRLEGVTIMLRNKEADYITVTKQ